MLKYYLFFLFGESLRAKAELNSRRAIAQSEHGNQYARDPFRTALFAIGKHWGRFTFGCTAALGIGTAVGAFTNNVEWGLSVRGDWDEFHVVLLSINHAILGAQSSFIGLVFPIVITLVDSVTSGRLGFSGKLKIFLSETEANGTAVTSIALIASIVLFSAIAPQLANSTLGILTAIHTLWALFNLAAIVRFLNRAIAYFDPLERFNMLRSYFVNTAWPRSLALNFMQAEWRDLTDRWQRDRDEHGLSDYALGNNPETVTVTIAAAFQGTVYDVNTRLLSSIIHDIWKRSQDGRKLEGLSLVAAPGERFVQGLTVGRFLPGAVLLESDRKWFNRAYRVEAASSASSTAIVMDLIRDFASDLSDLKNAGRLNEFERLAEEGADFVALAFAVAGNYATAPSSQSYYRSHAEDWSFAFFDDTFSAALGSLVEDPRYFQIASFLPYRVFARTPAVVRGAIEHVSLKAYQRLGIGLVKQNVGLTASRDRVVGTGSGVEQETTLRRSWHAFISPWEHMLGDLAKQATSELEWAEIVARTHSINEHVEVTVSLAFYAALRDEPRSAHWCADMLLKWPSTLNQYMRDHDGIWSGHPEALTLVDLQAEFSVLVDGFGLSDLEPSVDPNHPTKQLQLGTVRTALQNLWTDHRTLLLSIILRLIEDQSSPARVGILKQLIIGDSLDEGRHASRDLPKATPGKILASVFRMHLSAEYVDQSYSGKLSWFVESLNRMTEPDMVAGRVYAGSGDRGIASLVPWTCKALVLSALVHNATNLITREVRQTITALQDHGQRSRFLGTLRSIRASIGELNREQMVAHYGRFVGTVQPDEVTAKIEQVGQQINDLIEEITAAETADFENAEIDEKKLNSIGLLASEAIANPAKRQFPIGHFEELEIVDDFGDLESSPMNLNLNNWDRGTVTVERLEPQNILDDEAWWQSLVEESLANRLLDDVLARTDLSDATADTLEHLWELVREKARKMTEDDLRPILIVPGRAEPKWISDWAWRKERRPDDVTISHADDQPPGYIYHLNELPVFHAQIAPGFVYLLPSASFGVAKFKSTPSGFICVSFAPDPNNVRKGTLTLHYERAISQPPDLTGIRISYKPDQ